MWVAAEYSAVLSSVDGCPLSIRQCSAVLQAVHGEWPMQERWASRLSGRLLATWLRMTSTGMPMVGTRSGPHSEMVAPRTQTGQVDHFGHYLTQIKPIAHGKHLDRVCWLELIWFQFDFPIASAHRKLFRLFLNVICFWESAAVWSRTARWSNGATTAFQPYCNGNTTALRQSSQSRNSVTNGKTALAPDLRLRRSGRPGSASERLSEKRIAASILVNNVQRC